MTDKTMPVVALMAYAVGGVVGIAWRSWQQWRQTGSAGFRGISGSPGSPEWCGGAGLLAAVVVTVVAPALQLAGLIGPLPFLHEPWIQTFGLALAVAGIAATVYSQLDMGDSWRIGVDNSERTPLVSSGAFGVVRNPIYSGMFVFWLGTTLMAPNVVAIVGYLLLVVSVELQVRRVEEPYLARMHGDAYRDYARSVGRFLPGVGLIR